MRKMLIVVALLGGCTSSYVLPVETDAGELPVDAGEMPVDAWVAADAARRDAGFYIAPDAGPPPDAGIPNADDSTSCGYHPYTREHACVRFFDPYFTDLGRTLGCGDVDLECPYGELQIGREVNACVRALSAVTTCEEMEAALAACAMSECEGWEG
jgi:hypothetical protein